MSSLSRNRLIAWLLAVLAALGVVVVVISGGPTPTPSPSPIATSSAAPSGSATPVPPSQSACPIPSGSATACAPTDQDQYVYHPTRLVVLAPCIRMTGTIAAIRTEADGDEHILVKPDPAYAGLVNAANSGQELGDLVVEPVCENAVTQADAQAICASDHTQTAITGLAVGLHVWMEGRYVTDSSHGGWAELHPLYRWGIAP